VDYRSTYIIGVKGKLTSAKLEKAIGVPLLSPYSEICDEVIEFILNNAEKITLREYMEENGIDEYRVPEEIKYITSNGMDIYHGKIHSGRKLKAGAMGAMGINYKTSNFVFKKGSYY
jgi:hypothetical protein